MAEEGETEKKYVDIDEPSSVTLNRIETTEDKRIAQQAAEKAVELAERRRRKQEEEEMDDELINPKVVKTVKSVVDLFQTVQALSETPAQKAVNEVTGNILAAALKNAFGGGGGEQKRDLLGTVLNSQFGFGVGQGLGARGPEIVDSLGRVFGPARAGNMIDGVIGRSTGGALPPGVTAPVDGSSGGGVGGASDEQRQKELLLSLDHDNPEHVAAYAKTQGNISVDVARKMLMIHQDEFIRQMKERGQDTSRYQTVRSGGTSGPTIQTEPSRVEPIDNVMQYGQPAPAQPVSTGSTLPPEVINYMQQMNNIVTELSGAVNKLQGDISELRNARSIDETQGVEAQQQSVKQLATSESEQVVANEPVSEQVNDSLPRDEEGGWVDEPEQTIQTVNQEPASESNVEETKAIEEQQSSTAPARQYAIKNIKKANVKKEA